MFVYTTRWSVNGMNTRQHGLWPDVLVHYRLGDSQVARHPPATRSFPTSVSVDACHENEQSVKTERYAQEESSPHKVASASVRCRRRSTPRRTRGGACARGSALSRGSAANWGVSMTMRGRRGRSTDRRVVSIREHALDEEVGSDGRELQVFMSESGHAP